MASFVASMNTEGPINNTFPFIYLVRVQGNGQSATFTVLDDTDFFTSQVTGGFGAISYSITETIIATPVPAALPLFAAGLGMMGLLGWRRKRKGSSPSVTANSVYASEFSGRAS